MTEYELECVKKAVQRALEAGAPGISEIMRHALVSSVVVRLGRQFNVPALPLSATNL